MGATGQRLRGGPWRLQLLQLSKSPFLAIVLVSVLVVWERMNHHDYDYHYPRRYHGLHLHRWPSLLPVADAFAISIHGSRDGRATTKRPSLKTTPATASTTTSLQLLPVSTEACVSLFHSVADTYGRALVEKPLPTKSLTAGLLCGISDLLAQTTRKSSSSSSSSSCSNTKKEFSYDFQRTLRFASKGCLGGIIWMYWYDWIDGFLADPGTAPAPLDEEGRAAALEVSTTQASKPSFYVLVAGLLPPAQGAAVLAVCRAHLGAVTTGVSMVLEQLVWCPLVYGTFEIPVATLLNGASPQSIPKEVRSKLGGLLVDNFYVWTPANLIIYNAPLEWRLLVGNLIDIVWQSIVSEVAADCGGIQNDSTTTNGNDDDACGMADEESDDRLFQDVETVMLTAFASDGKEGSNDANSNNNKIPNNNDGESTTNPSAPEQPRVFAETSEI